MNRQLNDVISLAKSLNPTFTVCNTWLEKVNALGDTKTFLRQVRRVLEAEKTESYFLPRHYKKTNSEKLSLSYKHCRLISELIGRVFVDRLHLDGQIGEFDHIADAKITEITETVSTDGIATLPCRLSASTNDRLVRALETLNFESRISKQVQSGITGNANLEGTWWLADSSSFAGVQAIQELAFEPTILKIVQGVLGTIPIHVQSNAWWTFPAGATSGDTLQRTQKKDAQWFHQDMEFIDFAKVFVYLSDVNLENGPHVYVLGSANDYEQKLPGVQVSRRVSDEDIRAAFGAERVSPQTGPAGTILIANTRGYHKGAPVVAGHRLLLQFEYACSMYFNPVEPMRRETIAARNRQLASQVPRMFLNYRSATDASVSTGWRGILGRTAHGIPFLSSKSKHAA